MSCAREVQVFWDCLTCSTYRNPTIGIKASLQDIAFNWFSGVAPLGFFLQIAVTWRKPRYPYASALEQYFWFAFNAAFWGGVVCGVAVLIAMATGHKSSKQMQ